MEKICIKTFGCSINTADSERMTKILLDKKFKIVSEDSDAELIIINTCAVKGPSETKFFKLLEDYHKQRKKIIIAGCIAQAIPEKLEEYSKIGPDQIDMIAEIVDETLAGNIVSMLVQEKKDKSLLPSHRTCAFREIVPISQGCLGDCSYCITKLARGELHSYDEQVIYSVIQKAITQGVKEIWLTSQDTGCYGFDTKTNLPRLLKKISAIEGDYYIRVGMMNPNHVLKILPELIEAYSHPRIYKFVHIPIQSGSNSVLTEMNRQYTVKDYEYIVSEFKKSIPQITIATDIIVGYPTESEKDYQETIAVVMNTKPDIINLSRFWPRPHTNASKLQQLTGNTMKQRAITMMNCAHDAGLHCNKKWLHWTGTIIITDEGKEQTIIGRNYAYKQVIIPYDENIRNKLLPGEKINVTITDATAHYLHGIIIPNSNNKNIITNK